MEENILLVFCQKRLFARFIPNVKVELVLYEQNGHWIFKLIMIEEYVNNMIEYRK